MANYYVSAKNGDDSNRGLESEPFKTIRHASRLAKPGTTIHILS